MVRADRIFPRSLCRAWKYFSQNEEKLFSACAHSSGGDFLMQPKSEASLSLPMLCHRDIHTSALIWMPQMLRSPREKEKQCVSRNCRHSIKMFSWCNSSNSPIVPETVNCWYPASPKNTERKNTINNKPSDRRSLCVHHNKPVIKWARAHWSSREYEIF